MKVSLLVAALTLFVGGAVLTAQSGRSYGPGHIWWDSGQGGNLPWEEQYDNADGLLGIVNERGAVHTEGHAFFEALGTNGRACITCHQPSNAMSLAAATAAQRWNETAGKDPLFAAIDGSNCPGLPQEKRESHSLLLERGLFRIFLAWPPKGADGQAIRPEFEIEVVRDPTGCNLDPKYGLRSERPAISVYRRPRMTANLKYLTGDEAGEARGMRLMADGREPSLRSQAINAVMGHEQAGVPLSAEQLRQIVDFERHIFAAQTADIRGGLLTEKDGPELLGPTNVSLGKGGVLGAAEDTFPVWRDPAGRLREGLQKDFRASVARGSEVFFGRTFVAGDHARATCSTCHNQRSAAAWMDIGTTNKAAAEAGSDELPLFKITCSGDAAPHPVYGRTIYTQDPGRALISGKCADVGSIVVQQFRGLAARAPYFSNGSAKTLQEVIGFYDRRYGIRLTAREKEDLGNFLRVL